MMGFYGYVAITRVDGFLCSDDSIMNWFLYSWPVVEVGHFIAFEKSVRRGW